MLGLTMETPLLTTDILRYAAIAHGETEIVSRNVDRSIYRYSYSAAKDRCLRLSATIRAVDWRPPRIARLEYP
jgi:fatty-acyl-CoA synthase